MPSNTFKAVSSSTGFFPKIPPETKLQFKSQLSRGSSVDRTASEREDTRKKCPEKKG